MLGSLSVVDLLFVITVVLLVFNGLRNGFLFSLVSVLSLPIAFVVAYEFGPQLSNTLASNNLPSTPLISYIVLFFGSVLIIHILATVIRATLRKVPLVGGIVGLGDTLLGGVVGFVEAWLLWVALLWVLAHFLQDTSQMQQLGINTSQFNSWQDFYNTAVTNSLFARVNSFIVPLIHR